MATAYTAQVPLAQLQQLLDRASTPSGKDQFWQSLEAELRNFDAFATNYYAQVKQALYAIIKRFSERAPSLGQIQAEASAMDKTILAYHDMLGSFYRQHFTLAQKLEKIHKGSIDEFERKALSKAFCSLGFGDFVTMMGDIWYSWNSLKQQEEAAAKGVGQADAWVPPSAFIRSTRKYWVRLQDLTKLKLEIVKNLPLLRFGKKQGVLIDQSPGVSQAGFKAINNDYDGNGEADEAPITSVYFDNEKLRLYHDKIVRKEGATLIRIRWYGKEGSTCFMERKTWHDSWVMNDSIKERFDLRYDEVKPYIEGKLSAEKILDDFMTKKPGKLSEEGLREMLGLAQTIQKRILKLELKPSVRTVYNRAAFQASDNNKIRISIDTSLHLSAEPDQMPPGRWCYDKSQPVPDHLQFMFPMAVLEVKLSGVEETPLWLQNIIDSDYVVDAYKFSKFMHSTASLKGYKCEILPPWFNRPVAHLPGYPLKQWYRMPIELTVNKLSFDEVLKWNESAPAYYPTPEKMGVAADRITGALAPAPDAAPPKKPPPVLGEVEQKSLATDPRFANNVVSVDSRPNTSSGGGLTEPMLSRNSPPEDNSFLGKIKRAFGITKPSIIGAGVGEIIPVVPNDRLEPKTFFANERTYQSYLKSCIVIALGSFAMANIQKGPSLYLGVTFAILACLMLFYALYRYHWRRRKIREGNPDVALDDPLGPTLITILMILFLLTLFILYMAYPPRVKIPVLVNRDYRIRLMPSFYASAPTLPAGLSALSTAMYNNLNRTETQPYVVDQLDYQNPYANLGRSEYIKRRYIFQQGRSLTKTPATTPASVADLKTFAPLPIPTTSGTLKKINNVDLTVTKYGDVQVDFGSLVRKGNMFVYTWTDTTSGVIVHAEWSLLYAYWTDQGFASTEIVELKLLFDTIPTLPQFDQSADIASDVLLDYVYTQGAFCT